MGSTGAQLVSNVVSTTSHQLSSQEVILPRSSVLAVWLPTLPLSLRLLAVSITSSILCTPNVPLSTGMSVKVWKKVNSPKLVRIWLPSRRTTKRSESTQSKVKQRKAKMSTKLLKLFFQNCPVLNFRIELSGRSFYQFSVGHSNS